MEHGVFLLDSLPSQVYVDTVGKEDRYQEKLSELFPGMKITVTKKADSLFPIVRFASRNFRCARLTAACVQCCEYLRESDPRPGAHELEVRGEGSRLGGVDQNGLWLSRRQAP